MVGGGGGGGGGGGAKVVGLVELVEFLNEKKVFCSFSFFLFLSLPKLVVHLMSLHGSDL